MTDRSNDGRTLGEARRHFRNSHDLSWPAEFAHIATTGSAHRTSVRALGISLGGTFVVCDDPPAIETDLHLWLHPPNRVPGVPRSIRLLSQVRWINAAPGRLPRGFGVAFRAITAADEIALHRYFSRSAKVV